MLFEEFIHAQTHKDCVRFLQQNVLLKLCRIGPLVDCRPVPYDCRHIKSVKTPVGVEPFREPAGHGIADKEHIPHPILTGIMFLFLRISRKSISMQSMPNRYSFFITCE